MGDTTGISWADATWNFFRGCSRMVDEIDGKKQTSPACTNCYAEELAARPRMSNPGKPYEGLAILRNHTPAWTGVVRYIEPHLLDPLRWQRPRRIFTNSMSDIFHPKAPFDLVDEAAYVMQRANWHIYQTLTKRVARQLEYHQSTAARRELMKRNAHIHWGISVENQELADLRIPIHVQMDVPVRWLSCEPLLGPLNLSRWLPHDYSKDPLGTDCEDCGHPKSNSLHGKDAKPLIHWVVAGGESGMKARPTSLLWLRSLRDQCERGGIPFHFKQHGEFAAISQVHHSIGTRTKGLKSVMLDDIMLYRYGVHQTGNMLDGQQIENYPPLLPGQLVNPGKHPAAPSQEALFPDA